MTQPDKPKRKKWTAWRVLRWAFLIWLIVVVGGLSVDRHLTFERNRRLLAEAIAETDRLDPRWRWEEMDADRAPIPDAQNSAVILRQIYGYLPDGKPANGKTLDVTRADGKSPLEDVPTNRLPSDEDRRLLKQVLTDHDEPLRLALKLTDYPRGHHNLQLAENPLDTRLGHTQALRQVCWLLSLDAETRLLAGDHNGALGCVRCMLHTGASIRDEPTLISQLVRIALRGIAVKKINRILALGEPVEGLAELQAHFDRERNEDLMTVGIRGERAMFHRFFENVESGRLTMYRALDKGGGVAESGSSFHAWHYGPHVPYNHALGLRLCNGAIEVSSLPWKERQPAMDNLPMPPYERETAIVHLLLSTISSRPSIFARVQTAALRDQALLRCAVVGIACERYRLRYKHWPMSLAAIPRELLSELPTDPYNDFPLRYQHTDDGVIVYAVGPNLADDGGNLKERGSLDDADIGFRLWNVDRRGLPARTPGEREELGFPMEPPPSS